MKTCPRCNKESIQFVSIGSMRVYLCSSCDFHFEIDEEWDLFDIFLHGCRWGLHEEYASGYKDAKEMIHGT